MFLKVSYAFDDSVIYLRTDSILGVYLNGTGETEVYLSNNSCHLVKESPEWVIEQILKQE